ncbi:uncharacterized protein FOMMEDRAFT_29194 [Fomitiporia mediterranea MF3/22]|uniref:uncharacterized protein n=1 Tax=Fomitiporia mediterranea (strain MF3/22) TaxID=694068 RepID=UPI00044084CC|nr:uncharacterized protein FOMMEDRAFT_29194 [Fomitiporia mediterranea MF3/22]EJD02095.1 hypothetical protein FOMMEDRAFT_29194 [Fomitiporia mediterranea MF3/22]
MVETPPSFDLVVVGAGGGPSEANLSGYLLKTHEKSWSDGIVGIEAGSGLGALRRILQENPKLFSSSADGESGLDAGQVYSALRTYLISHAHLDHVMSLILLAGSMDGKRKSVRGSRKCLEDIDTIFNPHRIWPNLASWDADDAEHLYLYDPLPDNTDAYTPLHGDLSVRMFPINHGVGCEEYFSSAFFIRHDISSREFLFFGDVEPDILSSQPRTKDVWLAAAPKIVSGLLDTIFIECSWPAGRPDERLYGHLSPEHLVKELETLATAIISFRNKVGNAHTGPNAPINSSSRKRASSDASPERKRSKHSQTASNGTGTVLHGSLEGITIYIIHCKEDMEGKFAGRPMHSVISEHVRSLVEEKGLGATILAAAQGDLIRMYSVHVLRVMWVTDNRQHRAEI